MLPVLDAKETTDICEMISDGVKKIEELQNCTYIWASLRN